MLRGEQDSLGIKVRVGLSIALLFGAKVLNVQVPFYFKSIVDSMNVDFLALGGTVWTAAGSVIIACKLGHRFLWCAASDIGCVEKMASPV